MDNLWDNVDCALCLRKTSCRKTKNNDSLVKNIMDLVGQYYFKSLKLNSKAFCEVCIEVMRRVGLFKNIIFGSLLFGAERYNFQEALAKFKADMTSIEYCDDDLLGVLREESCDGEVAMFGMKQRNQVLMNYRPHSVASSYYSNDTDHDDDDQSTISTQSKRGRKQTKKTEHVEYEERGPKEFKCLSAIICLRTFNDFDQLSKHAFNFHAKIIKPRDYENLLSDWKTTTKNPEKYANSNYLCVLDSKCISKFPDLESLTTHKINDHSLSALYRCPYENCYAKFVTDDDFQEHYLVHKNNTSQSLCSICQEVMDDSAYIKHLLEEHNSNRRKRGRGRRRPGYQFKCFTFKKTKCATPTNEFRAINMIQTAPEQVEIDSDIDSTFSDYCLQPAVQTIDDDNMYIIGADSSRNSSDYSDDDNLPYHVTAEQIKVSLPQLDRIIDVRTQTHFTNVADIEQRIKDVEYAMKKRYMPLDPEPEMQEEVPIEETQPAQEVYEHDNDIHYSGDLFIPQEILDSTEPSPENNAELDDINKLVNEVAKATFELPHKTLQPIQPIQPMPIEADYERVAHENMTTLSAVCEHFVHNNDDLVTTVCEVICVNPNAPYGDVPEIPPKKTPKSYAVLEDFMQQMLNSRMEHPTSQKIKDTFNALSNEHKRASDEANASLGESSTITPAAAESIVPENLVMERIQKPIEIKDSNNKTTDNLTTVVNISEDVTQTPATPVVASNNLTPTNVPLPKNRESPNTNKRKPTHVRKITKYRR